MTVISKTASDRLDRSVDRLGHSFVRMEDGFERKSSSYDTLSLKLFQLFFSIACLLSEFTKIYRRFHVYVYYFFSDVKIKRKIAIQRKFFNISNEENV